MSDAPDLAKLRRHVWNWLPVFLEVAETGSIKSAAQQLSLTPAAVSRTLRLLQEEMGTPLFNRAGRVLVLNATGVALQESLRHATTTVDAGIEQVLGNPFVGRLRVASLGLLTEHFVVPCLLDLHRDHPGLLPEHVNIGTQDANAGLVRGQLEVAFYYEELTAAEVIVERVGRAHSDIYCGRGHPLFEATKVTQARILEHSFSVPQIGDTGRVQDGWPTDIPRDVAMRITMLRSNLQVCLSGQLLTVLPNVTAMPHVEAGELRRLSAIELPPIDMFAARHASTPERGAVRELIELVRERIRELEDRASPGSACNT